MTKRALRARACNSHKFYCQLGESETSGLNSASQEAPDGHDSSATESDDEIEINLNVRSTEKLKVRKSDKVKKLKHVCNREGFSENLLSLVFAQQRMNDELTFAHYNVQNNATITVVLNDTNAVSRHIVVKVPTHPHLNTTVVASVNDTIHHVKSMILAKLRFLTYFCYELMYQGKFLESHETLKNRIPETRPEVYLIEVPRDVINAKFKTPIGMLEFQVKPLQTIAEAKTIIGSMMDCNVDNATMLLRGRDVDESKTFNYYYILHDDVLEFLLPFPVYVQLEDSKGRIQVEITPTDHVNELNYKVIHSLGRGPSIHSYFFGAQRLQVGLNIASYGVRKDDVIIMGPPGSF